MGVRWMDHPAVATFGDVKEGDLVAVDAVYGAQEVLAVDEFTTTTAALEVVRLHVRPLGPPGAVGRFVIRGPWERCLWWPATDTSAVRAEPPTALAVP